jgi:hypothetical protein
MTLRAMATGAAAALRAAGVRRARDALPRQPRLVPVLPEGLAVAGGEARALPRREGHDVLLRRELALDVNVILSYPV